MRERTFKNQSVVCFGEVLWDIFPNAQKAGGAPFNVTYNLKQQKVESYILSRVGKDELGDQLLRQIESWGIPTSYCQVDSEHATGTVLATLDENKEAHYDIISPVAWDFIEWTPEYESLVSNSGAFVYGSLSARNEVSRNTLYRLLEHASYKIFDINLRPPFFSLPILEHLLHSADLVKINKAELRQILEMLNKPYVSEEDSVHFLQEKFNIGEILLTKGSKGALYYGGSVQHSFPCVPVTINDTVGSGDSFLAGYLAQIIKGSTIEKSMLNATAMGAFITSKVGACPAYDLSEFEKFKLEKGVFTAD